MKSFADIVKTKSLSKDKRNTYEFQAFGNRLADELGDQKHRALYIRLAKTENRGLLEEARAYVLGSETATTKGRLFMWKLSKLKSELQLKKEK